MIAKAFHGNEKFGSFSIKQTVGWQCHYRGTVVRAIKDIAVREDPEVCIKCERLNEHKLTTVEDIIKVL